MMKKLIFCAWIALIGVSLGCDGEKGDVGPQGPAGPAGPAGAVGDTGVAGKDALGAKVVTTGAVKSNDGGYTFGLSNLTPADTTFLTNCGVFVYIKSQNFWWAVPGTVDFGSGKTSTFNFKHTLRNGRTFFVDIKPVSWSEDQPTAPAREFESIRVIMVPTENFRRANANINWKDYNAVVKALGIKESDIKTTL
jgi:hypothetical protein